MGVKIGANICTPQLRSPVIRAAATPADTFSPGLEPDQGRELRARALEGGFETHRAYPDREGYQSEFLGVDLPLPGLTPELASKVAPRLDQPDNHVLDYTHFSLVIHKERRLPIYTVVNIDGQQLRRPPRSSRWSTDDRIAREHQLGNEAYRNNDIDRGHMVRRLDPVWGDQAEQANEDTFVYTNAALQHKDLNQREWRSLEDHILSHANSSDQKLTVFTGPVFAEDDPEFDNGGQVNPPTQIPLKFWKMAVWNEPGEGLKGAAFVLSQEDLVDPSDYRDGKFPPGRFEVYQVPIEQLQEMVGLDFHSVENCNENFRHIQSLDDVVL